MCPEILDFLVPASILEWGCLRLRSSTPPPPPQVHVYIAGSSKPLLLLGLKTEFGHSTDPHRLFEVRLVKEQFAGKFAYGGNRQG